MTIKSRGLPEETINQRWTYWTDIWRPKCVPYDWDAVPDDHEGWDNLLNNMQVIWQRHHGTNHNCTICKQLKREINE